MSARINIEGIPNARRFLGKKKKETKKLTELGLKKAAAFVRGEVQSSIAGKRAEPRSVDTTRFLHSIDISVSDDDAAVFSDIPYAKFLEFGTIHITPRRHFQNSASRSKQKVTEIIENEVKSL